MLRDAKRLEGFYSVKEPLRGWSIAVKEETSGAWRGAAATNSQTESIINLACSHKNT
jgi:hypothetical protein